MENDENVEVNNDSPKKTNSSVLWGGIAAVVILIGAVLLMSSRNSSKKMAAVNGNPTITETQVAGAETGNEEGLESADEAQGEASGTSPEGTENLPTGTFDTATAETINVEGGSFYFKPNKITVKVGKPVKIVFTNKDGFHDFVIDGMNVESKKIQAGQSDTVEFTPEKAGTFEFYCSIGTHRQMGMKGTLVVEE